MSEQDSAPDGAAPPINFDADGSPILSVQGRHVRHPDYVNSLPWIERRRLTYDEFCELAKEKGLPAPTVNDWAETFILTEGELSSLNAMIESLDHDLSELDWTCLGKVEGLLIA